MAKAENKVVDNHANVKLTITKISHIANPKNGSAFIAIEVQGRKQNITRSTNQFLTDLRESHLIGTNITDVNDEVVLEIMRDLKDGKVEGNVDFYVAGSEYIADANSSAVKAGTAKVGEAITREKDGTHVDGFLTVTLNQAATLANKTASRTASFMSRLMAGGMAAIPAPSVVAEEAAPVGTAI